MDKNRREETEMFLREASNSLEKIPWASDSFYSRCDLIRFQIVHLLKDLESGFYD